MNVQSRIELPRGLSVDAFFEWSERQADRYELVRGMPHLLPWVKLNHNRVVMNLTRLFLLHLDPERHELTNGDFAIQVADDGIRYADLMIVPAGKSGEVRFVDDARLIVEVLSESTMHIDFGEKLTEYQRLSGLQTYLIFAQQPAMVWMWSRRVNGSWPVKPAVFENVEETLRLEDLAMTLPLNEVYRNVV